MKQIIFISLLFFVSSCARRNLNYQSSQNSGYSNQDSYPAPQSPTVPPPPPPNYNNQVQGGYNNAPQNYTGYQQPNYNAPTYQTFYDELSPYGTWVNYRNYGYIWVPNMGPDFTPYNTNGYWVYTNSGWMWNSEYSWGWAPFHYGRWMRDDIYGWMWVPGNQWAPAWVTWGHYNNYYGWAPLPPNVSFNEGYRPPEHNWCFVPAENISRHDVSHYVINNSTVEHHNITIINNSVSYHQSNYSGGPKREEIEQATGSKINAVQINEAHQPHTEAKPVNNEINIYRPEINNSSATKAAPAKILPIENLKHVSKPIDNEQPVNNQQQRMSGNPNAVPQQPHNISQPAQPQQQPDNGRSLQHAGQPMQRQMPDNNPQPIERPAEQPVRQQQQPPNNERQGQPVQRQMPMNNQPVERPEQPARQQPPNNENMQRPTPPAQREMPARQQPVERPAERPARQQQPGKATNMQPQKGGNNKLNKPSNKQPRQLPQHSNMPEKKQPVER